MRASDDLARMVQMIVWLEQHPHVPVAEAAAEFGITPERMIDELKQMSLFDVAPSRLAQGDLKYLLDFYPDDTLASGTILVSASEYVDRPLRLRPEEAASLVVGLDHVGQLLGDSDQPALVSARDKLLALLGQDRASVTVGVGLPSEEVRRTLREAIESGHAARLSYDGVNRGHTTTPVVDPAKLATVGGAAYLQGWSHDAHDWRTYKADRIAEVELLDSPVGEHGPVPRLDNTWAWSSQASDAEGLRVTLDLDDQARYLVEYDPMLSITELPENAHPWVLQVVVDVWGEQFLTARLLRLAGHVRVVEPATAALPAVRRAQGALDAYAALEADMGIDAQTGVEADSSS